MAAVIITTGQPIIGERSGRIGVVTGNNKAIVTDASTTKTLKTGSGFIHSIAVGTVGTTWQIDFYDDTAGSANKVYTWVTADGKGPWPLQIPLANGLTYVTNGGTPGQLTIIWS